MIASQEVHAATNSAAGVLVMVIARVQGHVEWQGCSSLLYTVVIAPAWAGHACSFEQVTCIGFGIVQHDKPVENNGGTWFVALGFASQHCPLCLVVVLGCIMAVQCVCHAKLPCLLF